MGSVKIKRAPLAVQLEVEFLDRLSEPVRNGQARSVSEIIREAVERFDFANVVVMHPAQLQISVRLAEDVRRTLRRVARAKHTSIGHLVRAAVEAHLPRLEGETPGQLAIPNLAVAPAETVVKPAGRPARGRGRATKKKGRISSRPTKRGAMTKKRKG
jgi:Arc/MetJ-type ribon-helix-helix transcriptional regulator